MKKNTDIRISTTLFKHPKTIKLRKKLNWEGVTSLIQLWCHTAENKCEGVLDGMDHEDIAIASDWEGDPDEFVRVLLELRWLDKKDDGPYQIHDWEEHNPWAAKGRERSELAKWAANIRWDRERKKKVLQAEHGDA